MSKTFKEHADSAQMTEADRIAHRVTWDAAIAVAAKECESHRYTGYVPPEDGAAAEYYDQAANDCAAAVRALATD